MTKMKLYQKLLFVLLSCMTFNAAAWDHSVDFGYGFSHDPNNSRYNSSGYLLTADLFSLMRTPSMFWSINGGLGQWHNTAPTHQNLTTAALALALRYYPFTIKSYPAYLLGSAGPAYISSRQFGNNKQGSNATGQWMGGLGMEFNSFDVNLRLVHYSNAHITSPDQGFTVLYMLSVGYLF
jgi:hypothetical protein